MNFSSGESAAALVATCWRNRTLIPIKKPPTEAPLLRLTVKGRDLTVALPKFYVMTIDELPGVFLRGLVVGAYKPDSPVDMTVLVKDQRSIFGQL